MFLSPAALPFTQAPHRLIVLGKDMPVLCYGETLDGSSNAAGEAFVEGGHVFKRRLGPLFSSNEREESQNRKRCKAQPDHADEHLPPHR